MKKYGFNEDWYFSRSFNADMCNVEYDDSSMEHVRLPHTNVLLPYNYYDSSLYEMVCCYRKKFMADKAWEGRHVFLEFGAIAHYSEIYVNGQQVMSHSCGYTAAVCEITAYLKFGEENVVAVKADSRESLNIPPFGFVIDYQTYGGIYREAFLYVAEESYMKDAFVRTEDVLGDTKKLVIALETVGMADEVTVNLYSHKDARNGNTVFYTKSFPLEGNNNTIRMEVPEAELWDTEHPNLYDVEMVLKKEGTVCDTKCEVTGFRQAEFRSDGFYLNGKYTKIRGLNRHQSYPYIGYAMPGKGQQNDADILKKELGVNAVRTSHYPQSHGFISRCDELGLLVFTEIPGWQYIGDEEWKKTAVNNVREMVLQYRNHPSIILWGVRINESRDDDEFYRLTNDMAHRLDSTRPTGGVRCIKKSNLLEDVYTYNDFVHEGNNRGVENKKNVTSDMSKPYLISEYNGHMFPTKLFDCEEHRLLHALRHARVLDDVAGNRDICGSFGWCMFDYNTHKDFGSGDNICYHGVLDMFRNPKPAASVYASQQDEIPVLAIASSMDIGEHPGGMMGDIYAFTNADAVKIYKDGKFISEIKAEASNYENLLHGPFVLEDMIGKQMEENEGFSHKKSEDIKKVLFAYGKYGLNNMPLDVKPTIAKLMAFAHMTFDDAAELFEKYLGNWGGKATTFTFQAVKDGKTVAQVKKKPQKKGRIVVTADKTELVEDYCYDVANIRLQAQDEFGNLLNYYQEPVVLHAVGAVEIVGPKLVSLKGGAAGTFIRTKGTEGQGALTVIDAAGNASQMEFTVKKKDVLSV